MTPSLRGLRSIGSFRRLELDPTARRLRGVASVHDLRRIARRRLPSGIFDYIDGGAGDERSLRENLDAYASLAFQPRVLAGLETIETGTTVLGRPIAFPLVLAPTGLTRIAHPDGELAVARAASRAGIPYALSTLSATSIEDVARESDGSLWFQVYVWRDRGLVAELIARAESARYEAIVLTVDTPVLGRRERDIRHGLSLPPTIGLETVVDGMLHPGWTWSFLRSDPIRFANIVGSSVDEGRDAVVLAEFTMRQFDHRLSWRDVEWLRSIWPRALVLKGIQTVEDAVLAADAGVDAVILSNHGGRQLDDAPTPLSLVAPVTDALGGRVEVICDGGIRRGSDIVKALALGARACMAGRAYLYGLAAAGEQGVDLALDLIASELRSTMALVGAASPDDLHRGLVRARPGSASAPAARGGP